MTWLEELENIYNVDINIQHPDPRTVNFKRMSTALRLLVEVGRDALVYRPRLRVWRCKLCRRAWMDTDEEQHTDDCPLGIALANPDVEALIGGDDAPES